MSSFVLVLVFMSLLFSKSHTKALCIEYEFPGVTNKTITTQEDSLLNISFNIRNNCKTFKKFNTTVRRFAKQELLCKFGQSDEKCNSFGKACQCPPKKSELYQVETRVSRKDTGNWTWTTTTGGHPDQVSLRIVVTYGPSLTNLTVPSPVDENASVTIVCFWENGYPPNNSVPEIFDRRGKRFSVKTVSPETHVSYSIDSVQCDDAGEIVCKNSTGGSLSKTLLVRCGPSFQKFTDPPVYNVNSGSDLLLEFAVRSHSKEIQLCKFQKGTSPSKPCRSAVHNRLSLARFQGKVTLILCLPTRVVPLPDFGCIDKTAIRRNEKLTGTPPDLMFYASFSDVSLSDKGLQTLTLRNDVGSGQIEFVISVTEQDANFAKTPLGIFLIVVNAGIVAAITFRVIVKRRQCITLLCRRPATYGNAPIQMQRYPDRQLPLQGQHRERQGEHQPAANRRSTDTTSSNTYESVSDGEVSTVGGSHLCVANTETESTEDEYYLHPVASSGDLHELGDQPLE